MITYLLPGIASQHNLRRGNGRYVGPCPKCGGKKDSDKFVIKDDGGFKCYACDFRGDIITWLREMEGKTCPEAHEAAGLNCRADSCSVRGTCRLGDGSGKRLQPQRHSIAPQREKSMSALPVVMPTEPSPRWYAWAERLVTVAAKTLANCPDVMQWLADERGIDAASVARFRLGWIDHDLKFNRADIGLPPGKDGKPTLWVPGGLVIPIHDAIGKIVRLRIRRTDQARAKFLPNRKYNEIEGSGRMQLAINPSITPRGAVIVEAELDAMACACAHPEILAIALTTVADGVTEQQRQVIGRCPVVLVALDAERDEDGKQGRGPQAVSRWLSAYRQAMYWPVPSGKDPGDYVKAGGNLRAWIEAGLIPKPAAIAQSQDLASVAGCHATGGEGKEQNICQDDGGITEKDPVKHYIMPLPDGRELHVTDSKELWTDLVAGGKIAFSENELLRLQEACAGMSGDERLAAAMRAVEVKEVFSGAYLRSGVINENIMEA